MALLFFLYFAGVIILSALLTVSMRSIIHSAVALLVAFIHIAGIYILLNAEFLAAVQIVVYAGAILVLYLFVIMLTDANKDQASFHSQMPVAIMLGFFLFLETSFALFKSNFNPVTGGVTVEKLQEVGNTEAIGRLLYTKYLYPFEIASVILLVALIGAVVLSSRKTNDKLKEAVPSGNRLNNQGSNA